MNSISLIVPVYFEEECIMQYLHEVVPVLATLNMQWEIVFVDDGSKDRTCELIKDEAEKEHRIKLVEFSYNHGKQAALTAGIKHASGDLLLMMDPDLQDPPDQIPLFVKEIQKGYDLVFGIRTEKRDGLINVFYSKLFWFTLNRFTGLNIPKGLAVMRVFNREFAERFLQYSEQNRFIEGIFMHVGMRRSVVEVQQRNRFAGKSKFNFQRKMQLAFDAIFDFSEIPLKLSLLLGSFLVSIGFLGLFVIWFLRLFVMKFALGWPSLFSAIVISLGLQLFFIGIVAIYVGKIYKETKHRPLFSIKNTTNL